MMRALAALLLMLSLLVALPAQAAPSARLEHTTAHLIASHDRIAPDQPFWVLFQLDIQPGWHTYWLNPGDSGLAPILDWTLPQGVTASDIYWQPPERQPYGPLMNYGYSGQSFHLVQIAPPLDGFSGAELPLKVSASWLVCEKECIPEETELSLTLPIGDATPSIEAPRIAQLIQSASPQTLPPAQFQVTSEGMTLTVAFPTSVEAAYFFPEAGGVIEAAAPQRVQWQDGQLTLGLPPGIVEPPADIEGLLEVKTGEGTTFYSVSTAGAEPTPAGTPVSVAGLLIIFASAFLGGILLNAMPCVFPVLSLKALAISRQAQNEAAHVRRDGLAYTAGILVSFLVIGGALLALKAAGSAVGWGFQMQSAPFVAFLAMLLFVVGLNLSGLFDISLSFGGGQGLADKGGLTGSFMTGVLATAVATPCTAPFMATALGAAMTLPAIAALAVFLALGLGLAFPFLLLSWFPVLRRWLPKPGAWMETLKQALAFPIYLSVVWLIWVLGQQAGVDAVAVLLIALTTLAFLYWLWPRLKGLAKIVLILMILLTAAAPLIWMSLQRAETPSQMAAFSTDAIVAARAEGRPVFVYGTAAWCITCKVNERVALEDQALKAFMAERGIEVIRADWTHSDPAITQWLSSFGRNGVPLYVYYPVQGDPVVLPQILTPQIVRDSLS